ncbi:uncharacterized protein LOC102377416 isoform X3 [Alligator sinensis]|uniref:Uncharacterized protein LOC102377416 isoform X3 n=1 Tax=Alligator sinensis TaxID=38654 RepID=A0A3Q0GQS4_ALLSI|nr:uncharacterized protein LOC102377416 isoform X3 [Alligator sinensis]
MAGLRGNITLRYGVPMLHTHKKIDYGNKVNSFMERLVPSCGYRSKLNIKLLVIGGSFGLREFAQIRYDYQKLHRKVFLTWGSPGVNPPPPCTTENS